MSAKPPLEYEAPESALPLAVKEPVQRGEFYRLAGLFGLVYVMQGVAQHTALLDQPLKNYFKTTMGFDAGQTAKYLWVLGVPWMLKPVYGLLSDFVPLLGYRRKSYLLLFNLVAVGGFLWISGLRGPGLVVVALLTATFGVAITDVLVDALMVERGQDLGRVKQFQGVQWACLYAALIGSSVLGGWLCQRLPADRALSVAALVTAAAPLAVFVMTWFAVREPKRPLDIEHLRSTARGLLKALRSQTIWVVIAILIVAEFSANFSTSLYHFATRRLGYSEQFAGNLKAISAGGSLAAALFFLFVLSGRLSTRKLLILGVALGVLSKLAYLLLREPGTAVLIYGFAGFAFMVMRLSLLTMAAEACPKHVEGLTFAALMAAANVGLQTGDWISGEVYSIRQEFWRVAVLWAAATLLVLPLLLLLPRERAAGS